MIRWGNYHPYSDEWHLVPYIVNKKAISPASLWEQHGDYGITLDSIHFRQCPAGIAAIEQRRLGRNFGQCGLIGNLPLDTPGQVLEEIAALHQVEIDTHEKTQATVFSGMLIEKTPYAEIPASATCSP